MTVNFHLRGNLRTKKNSSILVAGRSIILPSEAYREWFSGVLQNKLRLLASLTSKGAVLPMTGPVEATMLFYRARDSGDVFGFEQAVADAIQSPVWKCIKTPAYEPSVKCGRKTTAERPERCSHCGNRLMEQSRKGLGILLDDGQIKICHSYNLIDREYPRVQVVLKDLDPQMSLKV